MARRFNRRPLTDEERDAAARPTATASSRPRALLPPTAGSAGSIRASNGLSRYSLGNQMLIAIDCHARDHATYVAEFRAFLALNRCVRRARRRSTSSPQSPIKQRDDQGEETGEKKVFFEPSRSSTSR